MYKSHINIFPYVLLNLVMSFLVITDFFLFSDVLYTLAINCLYFLKFKGIKIKHLSFSL